MTSNSASTTLGALCDEGSATIQTGPFGSQLHAYDYVEAGVPVVPTEAIGRRAIRSVGIPQVSVGKAEELSRHRLRIGDILFARRGVQATGLSGIVDSRLEDAICGTGAILLRLDDPQIDPGYISFYLSSSDTIRWLKAHAVGAVMPNLNESVLRLLPIDLPPIATQRTIAHILGTLDNKIELNRRMNETLEAMARAIFKSWFVGFDPVRAKMEGRQPPGLSPEIAALFPDSFEDSELGEIPKGWAVEPLSALAALQTESVKPYDFPEQLWELYSIPAFDEGRQPALDRGDEIKSGKYAVPESSVLVSKLNPQFPRVWLPDPGGRHAPICSTEFMVFVPNRSSWRYFLYRLATSDLFQREIANRVTGSTGSRQRAKPKEIATLPIPFPPPELIDAFTAASGALIERELANIRERETLANTRDALLPKLLSGELEVAPAVAPVSEAV